MKWILSANVIVSRLLNFLRMRIMKHNSQHSFPVTRLRHETTHSALQTFLLQLSAAAYTGRPGLPRVIFNNTGQLFCHLVSIDNF